MTNSEKIATEQRGAEQLTVTGERADLLASLRRHRYFLRYTVRDLTEEQAAARPTVSALCLGGLIRHVAETEASWIRFALEEPESISGDSSDWNERFSIPPGATLASLLEQYAEVARRTDELVASAPDLDVSHPLPAAPWFEPGARWSLRRVLLHIIAETAQHAGHADIIRETLDGAKSMG
jgi:hypothetical protein